MLVREAIMKQSYKAMGIFRTPLREDFKYYFADFVRKGGRGGAPHIRNLFFGPKTGVFWAKNTIFSTFLRTFFGGMSVTFFLAKILSVKGGRYPPYGQNPQSSI